MAKNIYYVEISIDDAPAPAGQSECRREAQFRIALPNNAKGGWDPDNDWSYSGLTHGQPARTDKIVVYDNGVRVFGSEPPHSEDPTTRK